MNTKNVVLFAVVCGWLMLAGSHLPAAEPPLADLIAASESADEPARLKAISQIGDRGDKAAEAVAPLVALLKDRSAKVRTRAAWALGQIGAPAKSAAPALAALLKDPDVTVRRQAVQAVGAIRPGPHVMVPLCIKLFHDADPAVRVRVMHAIAEAGAKAVPGLIEALKNDKGAYWACLVLREIGPAAKDAVPALAEQLKSPRPEVRREAVLTLAAMNDAALPVLPQIAALLGDEHSRTAATFALGQIGQFPAGAEATIRANAKSQDHLLSTVSLWALARVHPEDKQLRLEATEQLALGLKDKDPLVRVAAARALVALPPAPEITGPILEKSLQGAEETTVHHALDALAAIGAPAVPRLIDALKHEKLRAPVASLLGRIGPAAAPATAALAKLVGDKNERVAHEAAMALGNIGPDAKNAVPDLVKALEQGGESNAHAIAYALGQIGAGAADAQPVLVNLLKSPDRELALVSAWALVQIQPGSADVAAKTVPVLSAGLAAPLPVSRRAAAESLGKLGPLAKDAAAALQKAAADDDQAVREAVAKALAAIQQPAPKPAAGATKQIAPGDLVVTLDDAVAMRAGYSVVAQLPQGSQLKVLELRPPWVGVQITIDGKPRTGWVLQTQVAKF